MLNSPSPFGVDISEKSSCVDLFSFVLSQIETASKQITRFRDIKMAQKEGKNMQNSIIQENYIDEEAAKQYLNDCYKDVDLLPNVPEKLTVQTMAAVLNISEPTVSRMITAQEIKPFKKDVLNYILKNMLVNHPIIDTPEDKKEPEKFATKQQRKSKTPQLELLF